MKILTIGSISLEITNLEAIFSDKGVLTIKTKNGEGPVYIIGDYAFDYSRISDIIIEAESQYSNYHIRIFNVSHVDKFENAKELNCTFYYSIDGSIF